MFKRTVMRKYSVLLLSVLALGSFVVVLSSCDDDEPAPPPQLSFAVTELTAKESDANLQIQVVLDKPASEDINIEYSIAGTAKDDVSAGTTVPADYEVVTDYLELEIPEGETTGIIELDLYSDSDYEDDETIELSIEEVDSDAIEITRDDEIVITVQQEDGMIVGLEWGVGDGENYTDVDMDLFLWGENASSTLVRSNYVGLAGSNYTSLRGSFLSPEFFFLPYAGVDDGMFGISATYYEGTVEPMNFNVVFIEYVNGVESDPITKPGTYTLANINKWDEDDAIDPILIMKFKKTGNDYLDFEDIVVPTAGSRFGSSPEFTLKKQQGTYVLPDRLKQLFNAKK
jgi:hypothetical protein